MNNRKIKFIKFDTSKNWITDFPNENWCLIILSNIENKRYFDEIIRKSIDKNVSYICAVGNQANLIHDMADEEITIREIENLYLPKHLIFTVGISDFREGVWFGIYSTFNNESEINEIVILDVDTNSLEDTKKLIVKFEDEIKS